VQNAKTADWVVETVDIELAAHHAVIETSLLLSQEREFSLQRQAGTAGLLRVGLGASASQRSRREETISVKTGLPSAQTSSRHSSPGAR